MKLRKITALFAAVAMTAASVISSYAATVEVAKDGTKFTLDQTADGARADDTAAEVTMSWEDGKIIFNFVVTDSNIDNAASDLWQQDSVEVRVDSMSEVRVTAATGELSGAAADLYDITWALTDTGYEVTAIYNNADVKEGYEFTFTSQVNACSNGKRDCTIQYDAAHANAWQDDSVRTSAVLLGGGAVVENTAAAGNTNAAADSTKGSADTGVEGVAVILGLAVIGTGAVLISRKKK